jgi:iron complex outermembrane recepter protein
MSTESKRARGVSGSLCWMLAAGVAAALSGGPAFSQQIAPEPQSSDNGQLAEVVVTARYRNENLQTTPISITAITTEELEQRTFTNVNDLGSLVPNAYFRAPTSNYGPTETIGLRGISQVDFSYSFEPAVAMYVDDVYHGSMTGSSMDLADIERVEVLRGPQGTLFGKNSLGGAIRLITSKPQGGDTASLEVTYGQHHRTELKALGDFSLIDQTLFARVVGFSRREDGIGNHLDFACEMAAQGTPALSGTLPMTVNPRSGTCSLGGLGGFNHQGAKLELRYLPTADLEINLAVDYLKQDDEPPLQSLLTRYGTPTDTFNINYNNSVVQPKFGVCYTCDGRFNTAGKWNNYATFGDAVTGQNFSPDQLFTESGESMTADYRITDKIHAKFVGSYRTYESNWINDSDMTPFGLVQTYNIQRHRQIESELQLAGTSFADRLDWVTGLFYYNAHDNMYYPTQFDAYAAPLLPFFPNGILPNFIANDYYTDIDKSAFIHANFKLTDRWSLSAGVRYTDEAKTDLFQHYGQLVLPGPRGAGETRFDYSGGIDFQATSNLFIYGQVATGFRSPGFNPRISTVGQLTEVPGEEAVNYETGFKLDLLDHRVRLNTSVFYLDYKKHLNLEIASQCNLGSDPDAGKPYLLAGALCPAGTPLAGTPGISPWFYYIAAPASIRGVEFEAAATPIEHLNLNYSLGWNSFHSGTGDPTNPAFIDPSVRQQPKWNMSGGVQYNIPLASAGALTPRLDWYYQGYQTNGPVTSYQTDPNYIIPGYSVFNGRLTYEPNAGKWSLAFAVTNLLNKYYWQQLAPVTTKQGGAFVPAAGAAGTPGLPREWLVTFKKKF